MKKLAFIAAALALTAASTTTFASEVHWDKATVSYQTPNIDGTDLDLAGVEFALTKKVGGALFTASYGTASDSYNVNSYHVKETLDNTSLGLGFVKSLGSTTDLYAVASYEKWGFDTDVTNYGSSSESENGYGLTLGVKSQVTDKIELTAALRHINLDGSSTGGLVGANVFVTEKFVVGLSYENIDEFDALKASVSYAF